MYTIYIINYIHLTLKLSYNVDDENIKYDYIDSQVKARKGHSINQL
jgi:hypothetical protein